MLALQVKTIEASEASIIADKAQAYLKHFQDNPHSHLRHTAYLGLFAVRVYGSDVYFVVMRRLNPQPNDRAQVPSCIQCATWMQHVTRKWHARQRQ